MSGALTNLPGPRIRVFLAEGSVVMRAGLKALIRSAADMVLVGEAVNGNEAAALVASTVPHVAVIALDLPPSGGAAVSRELAARSPVTPVLLLSDEHESVGLRALGVRGYLARHVADRELLGAVRTLAAGGSYIGREVATTMAYAELQRAFWGQARYDEWRRFGELTERDRSILDLTARGHSPSAVAEALYVMPESIRARQEDLARWFGLASRADHVALLERIERISSSGLQPPA